MKRKQFLSILLAVLLVISLAACADTPDTTEPNSEPDASTGASEQTQPQNPTPTDSAPTTEPSEPDVTEPSGTPDPDVTAPSEEDTQPTAPSETDPTTEPTVPTEPSVPDVTEPTKPAEVKPKKITATVKGSYQVGDTLKESDFTVKVTMSDGTVLTNPSGWKASTMKLTSTSNKITVTYKDLKTTITVIAQLGAINGMDLTREALSYIGLPYVLGGNSLTNGTDCSGFTKLIFARFGIDLPRTPSAQNKVGTKITAEEAKPGDLLVETYAEDAYYDGHSGIYIGYGKMVSAMPGEGVVIGNVHSGMDYLRVYNNSYLGTDEDAYFDCLEALVSLGHTGEFRGARVSWDDGTARFEGSAPNGNRINNYLRPNIHDPDEGYESLTEAWKQVYLAKDYYIGLGFTAADGNHVSYSYWNGKWYLTSELREKWDAGELSGAIFWSVQDFYGAFWNSNATITTGLGEVVDLSTCPGIPNYSAIAKPGDPNEGKANLPPYNPDGSNCCAKEHKWDTENYDSEAGTFTRICWYCGYTLTDCNAVKDHEHLIEASYFYGGYFEPSYAEYTCLTCGYYVEYEIQPGRGADHKHDYTYNVSVYEPTCSMDGYTLHECVCTASYKDKIVACDGHDYGKATTVAPTADGNGYDVRECKECGHKQKDNYTEYTP